MCQRYLISSKNFHQRLLEDIQFWAACVAGTVNEKVYPDSIRKVGYIDISMPKKKVFKHGLSDIERFRQYFQGDTEGFETTPALEGKLETVLIMAHRTQ